MVAIGILSMIVGLIWGAFAKTAESKDYIEQGNEVYHQGRWALDKMEADLVTSFLNTRPSSYTLFYGISRDGVDSMPADELHFTSFNHVKYVATAQESDQCEVSYFVMENPDTGIPTLYRREDANIDKDNTEGGEIYELATNVAAFNLRYYDGTEWIDDWDSRRFTEEQEGEDVQVEQTDEMVDALPLAVEITLILNGPRETQIPFHTKVRVLLSSISLSSESEGDDDAETTPESGGTGKAGTTGTTGGTSGL